MRTGITILLLFLIYLPFDLFSKTVYPDSLISQAEAQYQFEDFKKSKQLIDKLQSLISENSEQNYYLQSEVYRMKALLISREEKWDKSFAYMERAKAQMKKVKGYSEVDLFSWYKTYGVIHSYRRDFNKALEFFQNAENISKKYLSDDFNAYASVLDKVGDVYMFKQDYGQAAEYFLKYCDVVRPHIKEDIVVEDLYYRNWITSANMFLHSGKVLEAKIIYQNVVTDLPKARWFDLYTSSLNNLGYAYDELGDYDKAIEMWKIVVENNKKIQNINLDCYNNLGMVYYLRRNNHEKAKFYLNEVLRITDTNKNAKKTMYSYASKNLSTIYFDSENDMTNALKYINVSLKSAKEVYGEELVFTNEVYAQRGRILLNLGRKSQAEADFETAWRNLNINLDDPSTYENNPHPVELFKVFLQQSKAYYTYFNISKDIEDLELSRSISNKNIKMLQLARASLTADESKTALISSAKEVYEIQIKTLYALHKETNDEKYIEEAFELIEKTNNILLLEAVLSNKKVNSLGLPENLLAKEHELKTELGYAETRHHERSEYHPDDTISLRLAKNDFDSCKVAYKNFLEELESTYPKYYQLNYKDDVVELNALRDSVLSSDQSLINFYVSADEIFGILISKNELVFHKIGDKKNVIKHINELRKEILKYPRSIGLDDFSNLNNSCHSLFNLMIKPFESKLTSELIIIPMEELSFIPFDILLKSKPASSSSFRSYPFLIKDHSMSYGYSATLISNQINNKNNSASEKQFAGFAPHFKGTKIASNRSELVSLTHNREEVEAIGEMIGGDLFLDHDASKENFINNCNDYNILHLATHGVSNEQDGEFSYLAFSKKEEDENRGLLYARDIYNLELNADLVVLSACETALGELQPGEGIISLARAFTYAGAKSTITTLWQVNDATASRLMKEFYDELKKGVPTNDALRNTKLAYLNNNPEAMVHPYYWSTFIPIGIMETIEIKSTNTFKYLLSGVFGITLLLVAGLFIRHFTKIIR